MRLTDPRKVYLGDGRASVAQESAVCAMDSPARIGEVFHVGDHTSTIAEEISRAEFERIQRENREWGGELVAGNASIDEQGNASNIQVSAEPRASVRYFYRIKVEMLPRLN
jgi:hypothetical protein